MSVLQQVLSDARKLATRLRDHDNSADNLLTQAQGMFKQVESMKEYCEEMNQLNEVANNRPRGALIHSIQQENRYIRELQEENKELRLALEEQQNVMELIMSKYREQVAKLLTSAPDVHNAHNTAMQRKLGANIERVSEMVCVMRRAAQLDEDQSQQYQQLVTSLARENRGLREMLQIAIQSGSVSGSHSHDADTQTEDSIAAADTDTIKLNPNYNNTQQQDNDEPSSTKQQFSSDTQEQLCDKNSRQQQQHEQPSISHQQPQHEQSNLPSKVDTRPTQQNVAAENIRESAGNNEKSIVSDNSDSTLFAATSEAGTTSDNSITKSTDHAEDKVKIASTTNTNKDECGEEAKS